MAPVSYCTRDGVFYRAGEDEKVQHQAHLAKEIAFSLVEDQATRDFADGYFRMAPISGCGSSDLLFWTSLVLITRNPHYSHFQPVGAAAGCGGCGGGCRIEGPEALIAAVIALVASIFVTGYFAVDEGKKAKKIQDKIEDVERLKAGTARQEVKNVYEKARPILQDRYANRVATTALTVTIVAGLALLLAATAFTLHAVVNNLAVAPCAIPLAIAGGATVGAGLLGHGIRPLVNLARKNQQREQYTELFQAVRGMEQILAHPYQALQESSADGYIAANGAYFVKDGGAFSRKDTAPLYLNQIRLLAPPEPPSVD